MNLTHQTLQTLVDACAQAGGGTVRIPAGIYRMAGPLLLRSGVHITAEPGAVLCKVPSVSSPLAQVVGYGHYEFAVENPALFDVGMGVHLLDDQAGGFYTTVANIVGREGRWFFTDRPAAHDYHPRRGGVAISAFALIDGCGVSDASVEGLVLDGNHNETFRLNGCRGGGVILIDCHRVRLRNIELHHYHGDGISFQQCTDIVVKGCHVHHNRGNGLHPGSGSVRYLLDANHVHDNTGCGVFYCLRTTHSICRDNLIENNGDDGISIGERDTHHLICGNRIVCSGGHGIHLRVPVHQSGDHVRLQSNHIESTDPKCIAIVVEAGLHDVAILDNDLHPATDRPAVRVEGQCRDIIVAGNRVSGQPQSGNDISVACGDVYRDRPGSLTPVGPEALPLNGARHLAVGRLPVWVSES